MKCPVCFISWKDDQGCICPQCRFDVQSEKAKDPKAILAARESFKEGASAHDPDHRVTKLDILRPWFAVILGFVIFCLWLRACSTHGRMFW